MAGVEQIKAAKLLGKRLRKVREEQGFNLAILASKLKMTVVELVAIEDGNLYAFDNSLEKFSESANLYGQEIGVDLAKAANSEIRATPEITKEQDITIPHFLMKK
jgi:transcriptional regulator with XRE-family HTH domain